MQLYLSNLVPNLPVLLPECDNADVPRGEES